MNSKTNQYSLILLFAFSLLAFTACEEFFISEVDNVKIPGSKPQLVVNSYISPQDTILKVRVQRSVPYMQKPGDHKPILGKADVYMSRKGGDFVKFTYEQEGDYFFLNARELMIEAGNHYVLKVETWDGSYAEAECFVPHLEIERITVSEFRSRTDRWGEKYTDIEWQIKIKSEGGEKYFLTGAYFDSHEMYNYENFKDSIVNKYITLYMERGEPLFMDKSGSAYSFMTSKWGDGNEKEYFDPETGEYFFPDEEYYKRVDSLFGYVLQTDFHYYRFHKSVEDYFYYDDDFPFAENVHIYTNIKGGLGTFGGYNRHIFFMGVH